MESMLTTSLGFDEAATATREALAAEGFGVLTEIDVQAMDPQLLVEVVHKPGLKAVADDAGRRLADALATLPKATA